MRPLRRLTRHRATQRFNLTEHQDLRPLAQGAGTMPVMCANCVAQGAVYVGGALTGLQVMAARARARRRARRSGSRGAPRHPHRLTGTDPPTRGLRAGVGRVTRP